MVCFPFGEQIPVWLLLFFLVWRSQGPELSGARSTSPPPHSRPHPSPDLLGTRPWEGAACPLKSKQGAGRGGAPGGGRGEGAALFLLHLQRCSQGFFWAVVVRGPGGGAGRGGGGGARLGLGTSTSTVISRRELPRSGAAAEVGVGGWGGERLGVATSSPGTSGESGTDLEQGAQPEARRPGNYGGLWSIP